MKISYYIIIVSLVFFHFTNNIIYLAKDSSLPDIDQCLHLTQGLILHSHIKEGNFQQIVKISTYYPPFFPFVTSFLYFLFEKGEDIAISINLVFLVVIIVSTFLIGRQLKDETCGLISAILVSFYPIIFIMSRKYYLDLPLTSLVCLYIYLLIASDNFEKRTKVIFLGIIAGIGMLTKWTFVFFVIIPTLGVILKKENLTKQKLINFFLLLSISISISSLWYLPNFFDIIRNLQLGSLLDVGSDPGIFDLEFYTYYVRCLLYSQIYTLFFILFLVGFAFFIFKKRNAKEDILLSHIISSYLILTFIFNKDTRFSLPVLPAIAIVTSIFLTSLKNKIPILFLIVTFSIFQYFNFSYKKFPPKQQSRKEIVMCVNFIKQDILKENKRISNILILSDNPYLNLWTFKYYFLKEFLDYINKYYVNMDGISNNFLKYDYIILKYKDKENFPAFTKIKIFNFEKDKFILLKKK